MTPTSRLVATYLSVLACASPLSAALKFTPTGLLPGGTFSYVKGLSADGAFIVGFGDSTFAPSFSTPEAFRGSLTGLTGLGDLPGGPTAFNSKANAVSADGSVVVVSDTVPPRRAKKPSSGPRPAATKSSATCPALIFGVKP
jgi:hypothetical protein